MGRAPLVAFIAVLCVAALPVWSYLTEPRPVLASTPSAYTGLNVPLKVPAGGEACADRILFDTDARVARFGASTPPGERGPALDVLARSAPEGRFRSDYEARARVRAGWEGTRQFDVPLEPPREAAFGTFCVRNRGSRPVDLVGSEDGRAFSRPSVKVDGDETPIELDLRLLEPGEHSLLSRAGDIAAHAATLRSFGAWWWWLLGLLLVTAAPAGVLAALRSAVVADGQVLADRPGPLAGLSERLRRRFAAVPGARVVAVVGALAVLWFFYWAFYTHVFQNDEDQYVYLSRWLQNDFPSSLFAFDAYGRGIQRLEVWLLAIPSMLFDSPRSLYGGRLLNAIAFVSTAIPVYLLGRGMGLRSSWAALPALMSVLVPWAVVTTAFLTENVAYPACFWVLWAIWRTATNASPGRDALALALLVVGAAARSGLLLLVPVLPIVVLTTGLRCGSGSLLARARTVLREHVVLWAAVVAGIASLLLGPLGVDAADGFARRLAGGYTTKIGFDVLDLVEKSGRYLSKVVIGTGFLPAAVGLPWVAVQLVRSRDPKRFAFALMIVVIGVALLYSLNTAGPDERYVLYLAPLVLLPAVLAVANREVSPLGLAIGSLLCALLVLRVPWNGEQGPFGFFVSPVEMFYARAVGLRLAQYLPGDGGDALVIVGILLGAAGVAVGLLLRRAPGRLDGRPATLLVAAVVAVMLIQTHYAFSKYVNGAGSKAAPSTSARAFIDRAVPGGATVGEFAEGVGQLPEFFPIWQEVQFYNERLDRVLALGENANPVPPGDDLATGLAFDARTGRLSSPVPIPDYLAIPTQIGEARVRGEVVAAPGYVAVALIRVARPATLDWSASGFASNGLLGPEGVGKLRFYGTGLPRGERCASFGLVAPTAAATYRLERGDEVITGRLDAAETRNVAVPLPRLVEGGFVDVELRGEALQVGGITVGSDC